MWETHEAWIGLHQEELRGEAFQSGGEAYGTVSGPSGFQSRGVCGLGGVWRDMARKS